MKNIEKAQAVLERKGIEATIINGLLYATIMTEDFNFTSVAIHDVEILGLSDEY